MLCKCGNYAPLIKNGDCRFCYTRFLPLRKREIEQHKNLECRVENVTKSSPLK